MSEEASTAAKGPQVDDDFVPVEDRVFGIDRRTIPLSLVVIGLVVLTVVVLPGIGRLLRSEDLLAAGEQLALVGPDQLTVELPEGWDLSSGLRVGEVDVVPLPSSAELSNDGVLITVTAGEFDGTLDQLLDRVGERNARQDDLLDIGAASERSSFTLEDGTPGSVEVYTGLDRKGIVMAFVPELDDGRSIGVEITALGDADDLNQQLPTLAAMAESLTVRPPGTEAS